MGLTLSEDKKRLLHCSDYNCVIPNGVVSIGGSFYKEETETYTENHGRNGKETKTRTKRVKVLQSVVIPPTVRYVRNWVFDECAGLKAIAFPDSVLSIGYGVFRRCSNLMGIRMPKNILQLGNMVLYDTALYKNEANWKDGVLYIGTNLVASRKDITNCKIIEGTRVIASEAFYSFPPFNGWRWYPPFCSNSGGNSALASVSIPDSVVNIGYNAFAGTALYKDDSKWKDNVLYIDHCLIDVKQELLVGDYQIEEGTRVIAEGAFEESYALMSVTLPDSLLSIGSYAFLQCVVLSSVEVPFGVFYIGQGAFSKCSSLASVTLPSSLEYMLSDVFNECSSLSEIKVYAVKPPVVDTTLGSNLDKSIPVYVPEESIDAYKAADGWCEFTNFQPLKDKEKKKTASVKEEKVEVTTKPTASKTAKAEPKAEKPAPQVVEKPETVASETPKAEPKHEKPTASVVEEPKTAAASATSPAKPNLSDVKKSAETKDYLITQGNDGSIMVYRKNGNEWEESDNAKGALRELAAQVSFDYDKSWTTRQFGAKLIDFVNKLS
ncbi:MAG: leucine-rich repeat protein [Bacteroidetes bacterium]|uniref:Leucine-rich repeat protein n=1 Tax=Candidatus Gallipaludibacter merdavium TaxID=2840839 RepID=A0A9D9N4K4_9BACT|nr:leucine-rich repeat protein [Candidatus Gallipaludibacter merdavium]